jgi:hypothetical protein
VEEVYGHDNKADKDYWFIGFQATNTIGYYSQANHDYLCAVQGLKEFGLQQPGLDMGSLTAASAKFEAE